MAQEYFKAAWEAYVDKPKFPEWMRSRYPEALKNFEENSDLLSTPFDVHETLVDILHFKSLDLDANLT
ncbi:unnamed protein product [Notodromas monacha]|uniref:Uncharacterized protein n=1 Tax=Notodromas monacha TaxID=399045 RepID=A0A7R9C2C4_9CRUS|nr:unnamed protein product [Notodromas monacha]CAG0924498.1 unnamed protein product [Notodromas monacha]